MKHLTALFTLLFFGLSLTGLTSAQEATTEATQATLEGVATHDFDIDLGAGFISHAQLTTPLEGDGPFPTMILFHGSGPYDMDATYTTGFDAAPLSANFRLLAERLGQNGIAVLRFNKRGVNAFGDYDAAQVQASTLDRLVSDAEAVLSAAQEQEEVDAEQIYLYGWSEGTWVAANTAAKHADEIAGLILQGTPQDDIVHILEIQQKELMISYLTETTDADEDGALTLEEIATIPAGPVQYSSTFYLYDQTSTPDAPKINGFVDANRDGKIDIETELAPMVTMFLKNYSAYMPPVEASYDTAALLAESKLPTLLLHGAMDGWVPLADAEAIADAVPDTVTLKVYPTLGHALSETEALATDAFGVMDEGAIDDMVGWLEANR
jgi:uncharacterized protein